MQRYEFELSNAYQKQFVKNMYLSIVGVISLLIAFPFLLAPVIDNIWVLVGFSLLNFGVFALLIYHLFVNVKLIVDEDGIQMNKYIYNVSMKRNFTWRHLQSVMAVNNTKDINVLYHLGLKPLHLDNEKLYIPMRSASLPPPMAFSDKAWVNPDISLKDAILACCDLEILSVTPADYQEYFAPFGSQVAMDKLSTLIAYISIVVILVAGGLLFLDDLFTLDYGNIKAYCLVFALGLSVISLAAVFLYDNNKKLEAIIGKIVVSVFFGVAMSCLVFACVNVVFRHIADKTTLTFTLEKSTYHSQKYDKWVSDKGIVECKLSQVPEKTQFSIKVYHFMTLTRYKMADICLADENKKI